MDLMKLYFHKIRMKSSYHALLNSVLLWLCFFTLYRMMSDYKVEMINDGMQEFYVDFHGPTDSKNIY